jgi:hypothetical protein
MNKANSKLIHIPSFPYLFCFVKIYYINKICMFSEDRSLDLRKIQGPKKWWYCSCSDDGSLQNRHICTFYGTNLDKSEMICDNMVILCSFIRTWQWVKDLLAKDTNERTGTQTWCHQQWNEAVIYDDGHKCFLRRADNISLSLYKIHTATSLLVKTWIFVILLLILESTHVQSASIHSVYFLQFDGFLNLVYRHMVGLYGSGSYPVPIDFKNRNPECRSRGRRRHTPCIERLLYGSIP